MITRFELTPEANRQLTALYALLAVRSPERADRWLASLQAELDTLTNFPRRCPVAADAQRFGAEVRELLFDRRPTGAYRILDQIAGDVLQVVAIVHSARG